MKPIFTIHAGEYLVATEIEKKYKNINVWVPSKDTGIDLLLTDKSNKKTISLQVKYSKDFNITHTTENLRQKIKGTGWWTLNKEKIKNSRADYWVFILYSLERKTHSYIIIKPQKLLKFLENLPKSNDKRNKNRLDCYITVTTDGKAFETRGLKRKEIEELLEGRSNNKERDLTKFLNNWDSILNKLK